MARFMDQLPSVVSCCFCCFLRAGTVMIALFSFVIGILFAPNVTNARGFWDMDLVLSNYSSFTESAIQLTLGIISIVLCMVSVILVIGACCNVPMLIEVYQWGAIVYSSVVVVLFFILAIFCFFVHSDSTLAGTALCGLIVCDVVLTAYFVIVANSLRMSLLFLSRSEFV